MSHKNGDRARFDRQRKEKIRKRAENRALLTTLKERAAAAPPATTSKSGV
jgi:hypothetical protein